MRTTASMLLGVALLASPGSVAAAQSAAPPLESFGAGIGGLFGIGTPLGTLGIEGRLDLLRWFFVTAGVGVDFDRHPQVAAMGHLRLPFSTANRASLALTAGYGPSLGQHEWQQLKVFDEHSELLPRKRGLLWWHNVELGFEARARSPGLPLVTCGLFVGVAKAANPQDLRCEGPESGLCEREHQSDGVGPLPYFGVRAGFVFD
jgi:hypothetical protein